MKGKHYFKRTRSDSTAYYLSEFKNIPHHISGIPLSEYKRLSSFNAKDGTMQNPLAADHIIHNVGIVCFDRKKKT